MPFANRLACTLMIVSSCLAIAGCSGSEDTIPESDIPDIPPATRTMPGESGDQGGGGIPAKPPG